MKVIIVLGHKLTDDGKITDILLNRMDTAVKLSKTFDQNQVKIILSGGPNNPVGVTEASLMREIAVRMNVPLDDIIVEDSSMDTIENAMNTKDILDNLVYSCLFLVTSDFHMGRALSIFKFIVDPMIIPVEATSLCKSCGKKTGEVI